MEIWLKDIGRDFVPMNEVYDAWSAKSCPEFPPTRACVEARMAREALLIEIRGTAAMPSVEAGRGH